MVIRFHTDGGIHVKTIAQDVYNSVGRVRTWVRFVKIHRIDVSLMRIYLCILSRYIHVESLQGSSHCWYVSKRNRTWKSEETYVKWLKEVLCFRERATRISIFWANARVFRNSCIFTRFQSCNIAFFRNNFNVMENQQVETKILADYYDQTVTHRVSIAEISQVHIHKYIRLFVVSCGKGSYIFFFQHSDVWKGWKRIAELE